MMDKLSEESPMKSVLMLLVAAAAAFPAPVLAQAGAREREAAEQAQRDRAMAPQRETESRIQRARDRCSANRGGDCDTMEGLQEWLLLDRSRADAVLDRIAPLGGGAASTGSSVPGTTVPDLSPRNVGSSR